MTEKEKKAVTSKQEDANAENIVTGSESVRDGNADANDKPQNVVLTAEEAEAAKAAAAELETLKDQFLRLSAEYDNFRKRTARERDRLYQNARADTIKPFLDVYDNLERAASVPGDEDNPHKKGLCMIFQQYRDILTKLGVEEIAAQGLPFDPEKHNAVSHIEDETLGENIIAQVFQTGFSLGGKVIRHSTVQVAN